MREFFARLWQRILHPKGWGLAILYTVTLLLIAGAVTLCCIGYERYAVLAYVLFGTSALALVYTGYTVVVYAPLLKRRTVAWLKQYEFLRKILEQYGFRTVVFAVVAFVLNGAYVALYTVLCVLTRSLWYGSLAVYYAMLTVLRSILVFHHRRRERTEEQEARSALSRYTACGVLLTVLPIALSIVILQIVGDGIAFVRYGWTIYATAAFAFYKIIMAIVNVVRARKNGDVTVRALRNVGLADALVSIFALQTSLLDTFSDGGSGVGIGNAVMGAVVCLVTLVIGVVMLVAASKWKQNRKEESYGTEQE